MITDEGFAERWANRQDRWSLVLRFISDWRSPLKPGDGYPADQLDGWLGALGFPIPAALREWYAMGGARWDLTQAPSNLVFPSKLKVEEDWLVFLEENQTEGLWGVLSGDLDQPDPPVWYEHEVYVPYKGPVGQRERENGSLSEFLLQMVMFETAEFAPFSGRAVRMRSTLSIVVREYNDLGLPYWHWPAYPTQFFGGHQTLLQVVGDSIYVTAGTEAARDRASQLMSVEWFKRDDYA